MLMAIATPHDQHDTAALGQLRTALSDALSASRDGDGVEEILTSARAFVVEAIERGDADHLASVREHVRQLAWTAKTASGTERADLAEWDRLLAAALTTAAAREARRAADSRHDVLSQRIADLLADGTPRRSSDIAAELEATRSQTSRALRAMHAAGKLHTQPDEHDRRGLLYLADPPKPAARRPATRAASKPTGGRVMPAKTSGRVKVRKTVTLIGGQWTVRTAGRYPTTTFHTQQDAIEAARAQLRGSAGGEIVVHTADGKTAAESVPAARKVS